MLLSSKSLHIEQFRNLQETTISEEPILKVFEIKLKVQILGYILKEEPQKKAVFIRDELVETSKQHITKRKIQINNSLWLNNEGEEAIAHRVGLNQVHVTKNPSYEFQRAYKQAGRRVNKVI